MTVPDGGLPPGCAPSTQYIYVFAQDFTNSLYRFSPPTLSFELVGSMTCPNETSQPRSIAVDRNGMAWVNFTDGQLFQVDTTSAKCAATSFVAGQSAFWAFGMGFSSNSAGSASETLFISSDSYRLGWIDLSTLTANLIGSYSALDAGEPSIEAEVTGTGNGDLYVFFQGGLQGQPAGFALADLAKASAGILWQQQPDLTLAQEDEGIPQPVSLARWGEDFYLFVPGTPAHVLRYDPVAMTTAVATLSSIYFGGAGASTCVPSR